MLEVIGDKAHWAYDGGIERAVWECGTYRKRNSYEGLVCALSKELVGVAAQQSTAADVRIRARLTGGVLVDREMRESFTRAIILATHIASVALVVSWLVANHFSITSLRKAVVSLLAALATFYITWLLQLYAVVQYALAQSDRRVEGVISNFFYVFTGFFCRLGFW